MLVSLALVAACVLAVGAGSTSSYAEEAESSSNNWHTKTLAPGEEYDVGKASANTTVEIVQGGTYSLKGKSSNMFVDVDGHGADVTLILEDGLNIDTNSTSNHGSRTPAINIGDHGGTVTILTTPGGTAKVSGYLGSPGIQKNGTNTKLVFDTQDHSKWGTLRATGSFSIIDGGAGIGSSSFLAVGESITGNIVIESGRIYARGGDNCAGLGGGDGGSLDGLTINGGYVHANGGGTQALRDVGGGAGIGGGCAGSAYNITINGGEVEAYGGENGAGIGGAFRSSGRGGEAHNIVINGGKVHASGNWGGAGIGGGWGGDADGIAIKGGTVEAYGGKAYSCAIGGGGGQWGGSGSNISISGGVVTATYSGIDGKYNAVIGSTSNGTKTTSVGISGGQINISGSSGYLIGGGKKTVSINISGGTITPTGKITKIGSHSSKTTISIIGGSVNATMSDTPINQRGDKLSLTTVALSGAAKGTRVSSISTEGIDPAYGMKDVYAQDGGKLYLWFPQNSAVQRAKTADGIAYGGKVKAGEEGTLYKTCAVTIDGQGGTDGTATVCKGETALSDIVAPARAGYVLEGYYDASPITALGKAMKIAETDGTLLPSRGHYTDADGKWAEGGMESVTLYANWIATSYDLKFDSNKPADASTAIAGSTETMTKLKHGSAFRVPACGYSLPGYGFDSWNTRADGTGTRIEAGAEVSDLEETSAGIAMLYAIWKPCEYTVTFEGGEAGGSPYTQTMTFDEPAALASLRFDAPAGKRFLGWTNNLAVGSMWPDGATVANLCALGEDGKPTGATLTARWAGQGHVSIVVTRNGVPASGLGNSLTLAAGGGIYGYFDEDPQAPGVYTLENVAPGTYGIGLDGFRTTGKNIEVAADGSGMAWLDYCDVQIVGDGHCGAAFTNGGAGGGSATQLSDVPVGSTLGIAVTNHDAGYRFSEYTATGTDPAWQDGDATLGTQTITVNGQTTIQVHSNPIRYKVVFNANGGVGGMVDQTFEYDSPQELSLNAFFKTHSSFACWTLAPEWSGAAYADRAEVLNLASEEGATVTLYAQYTADSWWVEFNGNGGDVGCMDSQRMFFGTPSRLEKSTMTMEDCTFRGWNTEADGSGRHFDDEAEVLDLAADSDEVVTLWAQWERDYYTVVFDANDGSGETREQRILANDEDELDGNAFARDGYAFAGWNTAADGSGTAYADGAEVFGLADEYETITLYAQWEKVPGPAPGPDDPSGEGGGSGRLAKTADAAGPCAAAAAIAALLGAALTVAAVRSRRRA